MNNSLSNLIEFDDYIMGGILNESLLDGSQSICNKAFINGGTITFEDGKTVDPREIVNVVDSALTYLNDQYRRTFQFGNRINIIYLAHSKIVDTMAVDKHLNLYINAGFVYHTLMMDKHLVAAVIMHEILHVLYNHIERGKNWLGSQGKQINTVTWNDTNLAADLEVNQSLVHMSIIEEDTLINTIKGIYLKNTGGASNVMCLEQILLDADLMDKLRAMHPETPDPEHGPQPPVKTTGEWDQGYTEGWNKLARLIKKYGYRTVWDKLLEAGVINGTGEIPKNVQVSDVMGLEYLVKTYDEYVCESAGNDDTGKTYDDGFFTAVGRLVDSMHDAIYPSDDDSEEGEQDGGSGFNSKVKKDDLEEVSIPNNKKGKKGKSGKDAPTNIKSDSKGEKGEGDEEDQSEDGGDGDADQSNDKKSRGQGQGGSGKSDDEITDDDLNKLADDLKKRMDGKSGKDGEDDRQEKGEGNGEGQEEKKNSSGKKGSGSSSIGGTGSFLPDETGDDILKDAGYSDDDIQSIREIRERNKEKNSPEGIAAAKAELRSKLKSSDYLGRLLDRIKVEEAKYKNVWREIMERFLAKKTRRAGTLVDDDSINWKRKSRIALGEVGPQYLKVDQDPQDVNIYVDVSGSMDFKLLEIISKSLVVFSQEYEYSGINVCPWASTSNGVSRVDDFGNRTEDEITDEILKIVSKGSAQCGGGTDGSAMLSAMIDAIVYSLGDDGKEQKDDVHVVITDGYFDYQNIESRISSAIRSEIHRADVAATAPENTFWMIYDAPENLQENLKKEIKKGKLIFINSRVVIGNG